MCKLLHRLENSKKDKKQKTNNPPPSGDFSFWFQNDSYYFCCLFLLDIWFMLEDAVMFLNVTSALLLWMEYFVLSRIGNWHVFTNQWKICLFLPQWSSLYFLQFVEKCSQKFQAMTRGGTSSEGERLVFSLLLLWTQNVCYGNNWCTVWW